MMTKAPDAWADTLRAIHELEPRIDAWTCLAPQPEASLNTIGGLLAGIPVGIKDVFDTADMPTTYGSPIFAGHRPREDAWIVQRLREAGAFVIGKTATTEFAYLSPTRTRNPHDPERTPGGSSSGSAAAVAAGMVPLAIGTQTAGSTIRPAAYCGVLGYKPSFGLVPMQGCRHLAPSLDTVGLFARDIPLLARAIHVLSSGQVNATLSTAQVAPRIRYLHPRAWQADPAVQHLFDQTIKHLQTHANVPCEPLQGLDIEEITRLHRTILSYEAEREFRVLVQQHAPLISAPFQALMQEGQAHTQAHYQTARHRTQDWRETLNHGFTTFDLLLLPSAAGEAPGRSEGTGNPDCCRLASLLGLPVISLPAGTGPNGMPLGLQLVARLGNDADLLRNAVWLAESLGQRRA